MDPTADFKRPFVSWCCMSISSSLPFASFRHYGGPSARGWPGYWGHFGVASGGAQNFEDQRLFLWSPFVAALKTDRLIEGSLNSKLPTIWRVEKQMRQAVQSEVKRCTSAKVRRKKIHPRQMLEKLWNAVFFQWFLCPGQSKSRPVKAAGAESCGQRRNQKLHAAVARRTFGSENVKKLTVSEHFLKLQCRKIARGCGEKHVWKWTC